LLDEHVPKIGAGYGEIRIEVDSSADQIAGHTAVSRLVCNDSQQVPGARLGRVGFENLLAEFGRFSQPAEAVCLNRLR
jgi:hypothetical protein